MLLLAVEPRGELVIFEFDERNDQAQKVPRFAAEQPVRAAAAQNFDVDARADDVDAAHALRHLHVFRVLRRAVRDEVDRLYGVLGDLCRGGEVVARAHGDQPEGAVFEVAKAVQRLVQGAVAADDDDVAARLARLPRKLLRFAARVRYQYARLHAAFMHARKSALVLLFSLPPARRRIHDQRNHSPLTSAVLCFII